MKQSLLDMLAILAVILCTSAPSDGRGRGGHGGHHHGGHHILIWGPRRGV